MFETRRVKQDPAQQEAQRDGYQPRRDMNDDRRDEPRREEPYPNRDYRPEYRSEFREPPREFSRDPPRERRDYDYPRRDDYREERRPLDYVKRDDYPRYPERREEPYPRREERYPREDRYPERRDDRYAPERPRFDERYPERRFEERPRFDRPYEPRSFDRPFERRERPIVLNDPRIKHINNPRFNHIERQDLKKHHDEVGDNFEEIGKRMGRNYLECKQQWDMWDSQPEWEIHEQDTLIKLFAQGLTDVEMQLQFPNRTVYGIQAKLAALNRQGALAKVRNEEIKPSIMTEEQQLMENLVSDSKKLVGKAKEQDFPSSQALLKSILATIDAIKERVK